MNEIMSLNIEFKRKTLDLIYDHLGRNVDREQSLETQSSLSSDNEAEGEDTEEEEDVQTDAASRPSQQLSNNGNEDNEENDENDIDMKSGSKPQALSEDGGFIVPKKREVRNNMLTGRHSNNGDEEEKDHQRGANQSLSITDMSMTDEDNKEKDLERKLISKRSHSVSHRDPRHHNVIRESPIQNHRENDFLFNVETNSVYEMKYFKEVSERLEFVKFILKNSDEIIKPIHIRILWECHIESSFHEKETAIFLEWCTSMIKIQAGYANTRREGMTIFDDDTIELIFFESLLCLDFPSISKEAYDCFEEYFVYINVQFGQLIRGSYHGSYEVFETKLIGIQALWEIVLQAKDQTVHQKASKFLLLLYKKLSPDLIENLNVIKEDFLKICMTHIKDGVKLLNGRAGPEDKENSKNRVARSLDLISKLVDEFEGLKNRGKGGGSSAPDLTVTFMNQMGGEYKPLKGEFTATKLLSIKDLKKKLCEIISPQIQEYELTLIYKGHDLGANEAKTLADHDYKEGGKICISKRTFFDDMIGVEYGVGTAEVSDSQLESSLAEIRNFGMDFDDELLKLALKKNSCKLEETVLMLTGPDVENLKKELAEIEDQKAFVPIITKEEKEEDKVKDEEESTEQESKLNLILSNKSEYFDLLFELLNLGVSEINIQAWNLLNQIPVNKNLYSNIKELNINSKQDWNSLMDSNNMYKLLYSLQIINSLICSPDTETIDESELQERYEWRLRFLKFGGFEHLIKILLSQNNIEESLKLQRKLRNSRKKNKSEDQGKVNYSIYKAGLYMINIIKIFIQASLLASSEEDNLLYTIISQSSTSPFMKRSKLTTQGQGANINYGSLLLDVSDGSKDNSSHNTPNFASPRSTNTPNPQFDNSVGVMVGDNDYDLLGLSKISNKIQTKNKNNSSICTQVDDFQKLVDQISGEMSNQIMGTVKFEKL